MVGVCMSGLKFSEEEMKEKIEFLGRLLVMYEKEQELLP